MRRSLSRIGILSFALFAFAAVAFATEATNSTVPAGNAERISPDRPVPAPQTQEFTYGPILSQDPEVRGQIKRLYREQFDFDHATNARIAELSEQAATESDSDLRAVLEREGMQLKQDLEMKNVDFGLRIARLNGDQTRVADFEKALDQLLHPEKYRTATIDPSIGQERARKLGLIK